MQQLKARDEEIGRLQFYNRNLKKMQFGRLGERRDRSGKSKKRGAGESMEAAGKLSPGWRPRPGREALGLPVPLDLSAHVG